MIPAPPPPKYLLIDGNNLLMRAIHAAVNSNMSSHSINTGPLHIFIQTLAKHVREENPTHLGIAWDFGRSTFRTETDANYKAHRTDSPVAELRKATFPLAQEFCSLTNLFTCVARGLEADDIIAYWWRHLLPAQRPPAVRGSAVILSSDKDFLQLVGPSPTGVSVTQVRLSSGGAATDRWNVHRVGADMGCTPEEVPMLLAIMGDTSDGVVGLYNVGPKRSLAMLTKYAGDFERICASIPDEGDRRRVRTNFDLVDLRAPHFDFTPEQRAAVPTTLPVHHMATPTPDSPLEAFLRHYELTSTLERWDTLWRPGTTTPGRPFRAAGQSAQVNLW